MPEKTTEELLEERGKTHGDFTMHSIITQSIKDCYRLAGTYDNLDSPQKEALDMIAHKIGRIIAGDSNVKDHWDDIAGYAKLVSMRIKE